jgi:hypothetical protein
MFGVAGNDERQIEKEFFTLAIADLVKIPILVPVTFIPLKAFTIGKDVFHVFCILQPYTNLSRSSRLHLVILFKQNLLLLINWLFSRDTWGQFHL